MYIFSNFFLFFLRMGEDSGDHGADKGDTSSSGARTALNLTEGISRFFFEAPAEAIRSVVTRNQPPEKAPWYHR